MLETNFLNLCEKKLNEITQEIESLDNNSKLDIEYLDGILRITVETTNQTYIINKHSASQKIWYSSPISGADYFSFDQNSATWLSAKGEELSSKLLLELKNIIS